MTGSHPLLNLAFYRPHFLLVHFWKKRVTQQRCWVVLKSPKNRVIRKKRGHTSLQSPYNKVTTDYGEPFKTQMVRHCIQGFLLGLYWTSLSGPEVQQIFKVWTHQKPDVLLPGRRTFIIWKKWGKNQKKKKKIQKFFSTFFSRFFFGLFIWPGNV